MTFTFVTCISNAGTRASLTAAIQDQGTPLGKHDDCCSSLQVTFEGQNGWKSWLAGVFQPHSCSSTSLCKTSLTVATSFRGSQQAEIVQLVLRLIVQAGCWDDSCGVAVGDLSM